MLVIAQPAIACDWCFPLAIEQQQQIQSDVENQPTRKFDTLIVPTQPVCAACQHSITDVTLAKLTCSCLALYHVSCAYELHKSSPECPFCQKEKAVVEELYLELEGQNPQELQANENFKQHYLDHYYPNAFFLKNRLFPNMCPRAISVVIRNIIELLDKHPHDYFPKKKRGGSAVDIDRIIAELGQLTVFLEGAQVWLHNERIFVLDRYNAYGLKNAAGKPAVRGVDYMPLVEWWAYFGDTTIDTFHALTIDYFITKIYSYALRDHIDDTFQEYEYYLPPLENSMTRIAGTKFEGYYRDAHKLVRRVTAILRRRRAEYLQKIAALNGRGGSKKELYEKAY